MAGKIENQDQCAIMGIGNMPLGGVRPKEEPEERALTPLPGFETEKE